MDRKRLFLSAISVAAAVALFLAGCTVDSGNKTGSISFSFGAAARVLREGELYRVEIYYGADLYDAQEANSGATVTFGALPVGKATVYVAQGLGSGETFVATRFGSAEVTIAAGENSASITLADVPFRAVPGVQAVASVVTLDGTAYIADADGLKTATYDAGTFAVAGGPQVEGVTDLSLSVAEYFTGAEGFEHQVWVNGSWAPGSAGGIMPWVDGELNTGFSAGLGSDARTVQASGAFKVEGATPEGDAIVIFYRYTDGLGGTYLTRAEAATAPVEWPWITINLRADLSDVIGDKDPVLDFMVGSNALYLVTAFTTLKISGDAVKEDSGITSADALLDSDFVGFATEIPAAIISIAIHEGDGGFVNLGTETGLWRGAISASTTTFMDENPTLVNGTSGYAIRKISIAPDGEHVAFISDRGEGTADFLVVKVPGAPESAAYRAIEGVPGTSLTSLAWLDEHTLLVGGNAGLAAIDVTAAD